MVRELFSIKLKVPKNHGAVAINFIHSELLVSRGTFI